MKLIIAGSRTLTPDFSFIKQSVKLHGITDITEVVSGGAEGVDREGEHFAITMGLPPVEPFFPDYNKYKENPKFAPIARNKQMAAYADALLLIWTGDEVNSRGSKNMKEEMLKLNKPVYEVILRKHND